MQLPTLSQNLAFLCIVVVSLVSAEAMSRQKKPGIGTFTCTCTCSSDAMLATTPKWPKYRTKVTFTQSEIRCDVNDGGGCRVKTMSGNYIPGTLSNCMYSTNAS